MIRTHIEEPDRISYEAFRATENELSESAGGRMAFAFDGLTARADGEDRAERLAV